MVTFTKWRQVVMPQLRCSFYLISASPQEFYGVFFIFHAFISLLPMVLGGSP